jgi:hypothetical protein
MFENCGAAAVGSEGLMRSFIRPCPFGLPQPVTRSYPATAGKPLLPLTPLLPLIISWKFEK